ncbi:MAG: Flp family type IVb pilin [Candidatus Acidiferrales bacterium]
MKSFLRSLWSGEQGQNLTEYALIVVLIALGSIAAIQNLAAAIVNVFTTASTNMATT